MNTKDIRTILQDRYPNIPEAVQHFEEILIPYLRSGLTPPNIMAELNTRDDGKYWSHMWEAILYGHFHSLGFEFRKDLIKKSGQKGPDFGLIHKSKTIWVEAIVPSPKGIPAEYLRPPSDDMTNIKAWTVPHDQKLLRWTSAIKEKKEKIANYIKEGVISKDDCVIIAVNSCRLQDFAIDDSGISRLPYAVEAMFPVGPLAIPLNAQGKQDGPPQNIWRSSLRNKNDSSVETDSFLKRDNNFISAVIGSHQRDLWKKELHLSLVHNPFAITPLPEKILKTANEYTCEVSEDKFALINLMEDNVNRED